MQISAKVWHIKCCNLQPSLASLGDGLPSRAGSQRDEAKWQDPALIKFSTKALTQNVEEST